MKRLLSFLTLFVLICMGSSAVPLSQSLYNSANCELHLGEARSGGSVIYGNGNVPASDYADLSAYSKLVINSDNSAGLRLLFNSVGNDSNLIKKYKIICQFDKNILNLHGILFPSSGEK